MPVPQDPDQPLAQVYLRPQPPAAAEESMRRRSEESMRTEDCEGPVPDTPVEDPMSEKENNDAGSGNAEAFCSNRAELIERLKRGESPNWVPNQSLQQEYLKANGEEMPLRPTSSKASNPTSLLLPAVELRSSKSMKQESHESVKGLAMATELQRPRSALHAGDFTEDSRRNRDFQQNSPRPALSSVYPSSNGPLGTSPTTPWYRPASPFEDKLSNQGSFRERDYDIHSERRPIRSRAPSLSSFSSSSYVLKAPTTPLVQQSNNADLDFSARDRSNSPSKSSRRHTLPPHALQCLHTSASSPGYPVSLRQQSQPHHSYQRESSFHYGHHPRRSLNSNWSLQPSASPPTAAFARSRRTSFNSSDASPLQHASMVGSYEESILRGRMSTAPSKPVDFTAQIGVLGRGTCKPKCPAHVTVPFPAVYYNWGIGNGRSPANDEPSPYVGHIDLQHCLQQASSTISARDDIKGMAGEGEDQLPLSGMGAGDATLGLAGGPGKQRKRRRAALVAPPEGSYRIPEQGQLQIIIKNPNKTAVKLFLVPYDLTGMEPGTKTFLRQRLYSAGPILESPLASKTALRMGSPFELTKKPTLRYLIHINICCSSKGRFYLYQHIRVVFANRVPDNKEQLRTEIQVPDPRFSPWKPVSLSRHPSSAGAKLTAEKAFRRRSSGYGFGEALSGPWSPDNFAGGSTFPSHGGEAAPPVPAIPFNLPSRKAPPTSENDHNESDAMDIDTSRPTTGSDMQSPSDNLNLYRLQNSGSFLSTSSQGSGDYGKLNPGDLGYGGVFGRPSTPEPGEGLLARRLKSLGVQRGVSSDGFEPEL